MRARWRSVRTINDNIMDQQMLAIRLMERLMEDHADALTTRFKLKNNALRGVPLLEACRCRGGCSPAAYATRIAARGHFGRVPRGQAGAHHAAKTPVKAPKETTPMREAKKRNRQTKN